MPELNTRLVLNYSDSDPFLYKPVSSRLPMGNSQTVHPLSHFLDWLLTMQIFRPLIALPMLCGPGTSANLIQPTIVADVPSLDNITTSSIQPSRCKGTSETCSKECCINFFGFGCTGSGGRPHVIYHWQRKQPTPPVLYLVTTQL